MELTQVLGWVATVLFSVMLIPQIIKTWKLRDTRGVSLFLFVIYLIANIIALVYALMINQFPLIIRYEIAIGTSLVYIFIFLLFYFKRRK